MDATCPVPAFDGPPDPLRAILQAHLCAECNSMLLYVGNRSVRHVYHSICRFSEQTFETVAIELKPCGVPSVAAAAKSDARNMDERVFSLVDVLSVMQAADNLVSSRIGIFETPTGFNGYEPTFSCHECHMVAVANTLTHAETCRAGRMLRAIEKIKAAANAPLEFTPIQTRKEDARDDDRVRAGAGTPLRGAYDAAERRGLAPDFGEPLSAKWQNGVLRFFNRERQPLAWDDKVWRDCHRRTVACMNFCAGIPTATLEAQKPLTDLTRDIQEQIYAARILRSKDVAGL